MAGSPNPLDLIGKLIRLATNNPNEAEAMRAALKACKLLVEHHCDISIPNGKPKTPPNPYAGGRNPWDDFMRQAAATQRHYDEEFVRREREKRAAEKVKEQEQERRAQEWADEMKAKAKKPGGGHEWNPATMRCRKCGITVLMWQRLGAGAQPCYG